MDWASDSNLGHDLFALGSWIASCFTPNMLTPLHVDSTGDEHAGTCLAGPDEDPTGTPQSGIVAPPRYWPGSVLSGKYRLDTLLGEGGMGAVWRASNLLLDLPVAIKLIRADLDRGSLRARLQLEARSAAKLGHPGIVRVFDVGESEFGDPFIVMELLSGETLAQLLSRGRLSSAYAVQILLPIIDALAMAHARGIVHRDLKPDNVMLTVEQAQVQPKILDFGIAKLTDTMDLDHRLTEVGTVVGSPDYMSPEQACGRDDVDASTDIWSMCVVLYESMAGVPPFSAPNYNALLRAIVEDEPTPLTEHGAGDSALWAILARGLAKQREDRYANIADLGQALAHWLCTHGIHEDVCGTSLDSKWLGHAASAASELTPSSGSRAISADFVPNVTRESHPSGLRGPYTATIRPVVANRTRWLGALAACALLGGAVQAINQRATVPDASRKASLESAHPSLPAARPVPVVAAAAAMAPIATPPATTPDATPPASVGTRGASDPPKLAKAPRDEAKVQKSSPPRTPVEVTRGAAKGLGKPAAALVASRPTLPRTTAAVPNASKSGATPSSSPPPPPKSASKPLDLLTPY